MTKLENSLHLERYLSLIPGPSRELYRILATSILSRELFTLLEDRQALTNAVISKVVLEKDMIRPILNKDSFKDKSLKMPSINAEKRVSFPNSNDFNRKLDRLIEKSALQKENTIIKLKLKSEQRFLTLHSNKSLLYSGANKGLVQEISIETLLYYIKKYKLPWIKLEEPITAELFLTLNTLYLEGGIYKDINTLYITSKKLL
jgi:hypothetical protein